MEAKTYHRESAAPSVVIAETRLRVIRDLASFREDAGQGASAFPA
jgi:hypothetical protein